MNFIKKTVLVIAALCTAVFVADAQAVKVTGKVLDASSNPVLGAGVKQVGTTNGVVTDFNGAFSISVPAGALLEVSALGYETQTVTVVDGRKDYVVVLSEEALELDDVVVVGYGTQRKKLRSCLNFNRKFYYT